MSMKKLIPIDVWPLIGVVTLACGFGGYMGYRFLFLDKDVWLSGRHDGHQHAIAHADKPHLVNPDLQRIDPTSDILRRK